jgi:glyoxylase-like metal-dependent hydrolase (beta-lactamase superfamily II)
VYLPDQQRVMYRFMPLRNGSIIKVGEASLMAIQTPGHTAESMCYLLDRQALFTGDTLFLQGVGRPDLHATTEETRSHAHLLYHSLHHHLLLFPAHTLVLPGHINTPTPFDKIPLTATLGDLWNKVELLRLSESEFVERLVARIPPVPPNHEYIIELNESGRLIEAPVELEAGANNCAVS